MTEAKNVVQENHLVVNCDLEIKLPVNLISDRSQGTTMIVEPGQEIICPRRQPKGRNIIPSGTNEEVHFDGCEGCNAYKPTTE